MPTTNNVFKNGHNFTHFKSDLLSLTEHVIFWRLFIIFNNGKFQSPKSSTGTLISVKSLLPR